MFKPHFKRFYHAGESYFITTQTEDRIEFFKDFGCCRVLLENMKLAKKLMAFKIYAFIIMTDHIHWIICPLGVKNISEIMHFVKRNSTREINEKIKNPTFPIIPVAKDHDPWPQEVRDHKLRIKNIKIGNNIKFQWQSSFHDRLLRNDKEFWGAMNYINHKNAYELVDKYKLNIDKNGIIDYPFYSYTNPDLIDPV